LVAKVMVAPETPGKAAIFASIFAAQSALPKFSSR
jgi:hypothetical protein